MMINVLWPQLGHSGTSTLSLMILNYEILESCTKSLHKYKHIYDVNVVILDAHGCITRAFLTLRSVLAFLILLSGWSVVTFNQRFLVH